MFGASKENSLMHYGVMGMKWGFRKAPRKGFKQRYRMQKYRMQERDRLEQYMYKRREAYDLGQAILTDYLDSSWNEMRGPSDLPKTKALGVEQIEKVLKQ